MRVLALVKSADDVCYRYRLEAFAWTLAEQGLLMEAQPLHRGVRRLGQLWATSRADLVILQRHLLRLPEWLLLRRRARRLIYDVDDALFLRDSYHPRGERSDWRMFHFWTTIFGADAVLAGNPFLAEFAARFTDRDRVMTMPTCVDPRRYQTARHLRRGAAVRLAWIGQSSTLRSLDVAQPQLRAAAACLPGLRMRVICDRLARVPGMRMEFCAWSSQSEAEDLAGSDIGVNWLPADRWSEGKCGLRVLQYMAAGLPVVANPVGMNRTMVIDGETGFLAETPADWAAAIERLALDPALRRQMGAAGRRLLEQHYNIEGWGPRLARFIRQVAIGGNGQLDGARLDGARLDGARRPEPRRVARSHDYPPRPRGAAAGARVAAEREQG